MTRLRNFVFVAAVVLVFRLSANATIVFNWPTNPGWTAGTPTAGETFTQSFTSVNPNDITVSVNNSGNGAQGMNLQTNYPQVSRSPLTGGFGSTDALQLFVSSSQAVGTFLRTTVTFDTPVTNLTFQIWDVDALAGQFVDKIANIQGLAQGGGTVGADSVTSTVAGYNSITGTGLNIVVLGTANANNGNNQGSINITFNGQITQFSFDWSNNDPALGAQAIAIGPLSYNPVPEIETKWSIIGACTAVILFELLRRRRQRHAAKAPVITGRGRVRKLIENKLRTSITNIRPRVSILLLTPLLFAFVVSPAARGSLVFTYDFPQDPGSGAAAAQSNPQPTGATFGDFTRNTVGAAPMSPYMFGSNNWSQSGSIDPTFFEGFSITADVGVHLDLSNLNFTAYRSATGPQNMEIGLFLNGSSTAYATYDFSPATSTTAYAFNFTPLTDSDNTTTATFKFYGWNAGGMGGQLYVSDVATYGTISSAPEPATLLPALCVLACAVAAGKLRRVVRRTTSPSS